jgi:hypothetical protein
MSTIMLEELEVTSFFTETVAEDRPGPGYTNVCYYTDAVDCEFTLPVEECYCTADFSTCSRTSVEGGCATDVQCVTV